MQTKPGILSLLIILLIVVTFISPALSQKIEIVNGVQIVHNEKPKWGKNPEVELEFIRQIGVYEGPDENYMFFRPIDIKEDKQGNLYVLDAGNYRIQKFDPDGKYLKTFGRRGQGPGEFSISSSINIDNEGNLLVCTSGGIIVFSQDGREERRIYLEKAKSQDLLILQSGNIIAPTIIDTALVSICNSDGNLIQLFGLRKNYPPIKQLSSGNIKVFRSGRMDIGINFSPSIHQNHFFFTKDEEDNIYLVFHIQNRIEKYTKYGKLIFKSERPLNYEESTQPKMRKLVNYTGGGSFVYELPLYNLVSERSSIDSKGRLWTTTYIYQPNFEKELDPSKYMHFEIFDSDGILLGYLPLPDKSAKNFRIYKDRLYLINNLTEMCIYEYKIIEK